LLKFFTFEASLWDGPRGALVLLSGERIITTVVDPAVLKVFSLCAGPTMDGRIVVSCKRYDSRRYICLHRNMPTYTSVVTMYLAKKRVREMFSVVYVYHTVHGREGSGAVWGSGEVVWGCEGSGEAVCMYLYAYIYIHICICTYKNIYIFIYVYVYTARKASWNSAGVEPRPLETSRCRPRLAHWWYNSNSTLVPS